MLAEGRTIDSPPFDGRSISHLRLKRFNTLRRFLVGKARVAHQHPGTGVSEQHVLIFIMVTLSGAELRIVIALLFGLFVCSISSASTLVGEESSLQTFGGDHFRGECIHVQEGVILWRTVFKDTVRIPIADVSVVAGEGLWDLSFRDGQTVRASWSISAGNLLIESSLFGRIQCPTRELVSAERAVTARGLSDTPKANAAAEAPKAQPDNPAAPTQNEPPTSSLQTLLRQSSILLRPGQWSISTGMDYTHNRVLYSPVDTRQVGLTALIQRGLTRMALS